MTEPLSNKQRFLERAGLPDGPPPEGIDRLPSEPLTIGGYFALAYQDPLAAKRLFWPGGIAPDQYAHLRARPLNPPSEPVPGFEKPAVEWVLIADVMALPGIADDPCPWVMQAPNVYVHAATGQLFEQEPGTDGGRLREER